VVFTRRYEAAEPQILLERQAVWLGASLKYLGIMLKPKGMMVDAAANKAQRIMGALGRLIPNVSGLSDDRRRLFVSVVHSVLIYGAPT